MLLHIYTNYQRNETTCSIKGYERLFNLVTKWWMFKLHYISNKKVGSMQENTGNYWNTGEGENKMLEILAYAAYFSPFCSPVKKEKQ